MNDNKEKSLKNLKVPLAKPWIGEEEAEAARRVVASGWLIFGPEVEAFEGEFATKMGAKYAIAVNSGSSALLVAQAACGIGSGDEVIVPDMTFVSTATSGLYLGARPIFVDLRDDDHCIDPERIEAAVTPRTRAILPVHYAGQAARMKEILEIARRRNLVVIEDAAESHLSRDLGKFTGTIGEIGIFSFTPSKPMTTGEGGMIVTDREDLAQKCRLLRNFGDVDKFKWQILGFNFRMPEVMGAIGRIQLRKLEETVKRRRRIAARYTETLRSLEGLILPFVRHEESHNFQLYTLRIRLEQFSISRDQWIAELQKRGVSARLYYPALHDQEVFSQCRPAVGATFPRTEAYVKGALSLPIYPTLSDAEQEIVISAMTNIYREFRGQLT